MAIGAAAKLQEAVFGALIGDEALSFLLTGIYDESQQAFAILILLWVKLVLITGI